MSASPTIAQPIPGAVPGAEPLPGTDEVPPGGAGPVDGTAEEPPRRRRRKILLLLLLMAGFLALLGLAIWYLLFRQPIPIPVIPGETVMPGYVTSIYGTDRPMGAAVSSSGDRIYVGETSGDRIATVFDAGGNQVALMQPPVSTGPEHTPVYLAVNPVTTEVYVSDRATGAIYVYDANGTYQRSYEPKVPIAGWQPLGVAFDTAGNLYVTDLAQEPQRIHVFDPAGVEIRTLGLDAGLSFPNELAVDAAGNVYVADSNNGRLLVFGTDGKVVAQVGRGAGEGNLGLPRGVAIDGQGRVYVADSTGQGVFVYSVLTPGAKRLDYLGFFGGEGVANGRFEYPNSVAVDGRGRLYVADSVNDRVQLWSY
jgi:DNA-binding beta-propeller fold protein YncE